MKIKEIAKKINVESANYRIGELQTLRKKIKNKKRKPHSSIFVETPNTMTDNWAYHYGGRSELQFNIGLEEEGLRYGIAFSLETSQSLPDISILFPKILKLNNIIREKPTFFHNYSMWIWGKNQRSKILPVTEINANNIVKDNFIFIGKIMNLHKIDFGKILNSFDELLDIYLEVESEVNETTLVNDESNSNFVFKSGMSRLPVNSNYNTTERSINIDIRHSFLQKQLYEYLSDLFGEEAVGVENNINGNRIDVVLQIGDKTTFFEIKTANSAKACVRQAFGQLMEYAYYEGKSFASNLVVIGEHKIDKKTKKYLKYIKQKFKLNIDYRDINELVKERKMIIK